MNRGWRGLVSRIALRKGLAGDEADLSKFAALELIRTGEKASLLLAVIAATGSKMLEASKHQKTTRISEEKTALISAVRKKFGGPQFPA